MTKPVARCIRIDLDDDETPALLTIVMTDDVLGRVRRDFDLDASRRIDRLMESQLDMAEAADMARHFGQDQTGNEATVEFYYCVANIVNSFYDEGFDEAPSAGLVARSAGVKT